MTIAKPSDTWRVIVQAFIFASQKQNETGHQTTTTSHARKQPNPAQKNLPYIKTFIILPANTQSCKPHADQNLSNINPLKFPARNLELRLDTAPPPRLPMRGLRRQRRKLQYTRHLHRLRRAVDGVLRHHSVSVNVQKIPHTSGRLFLTDIEDAKLVQHRVSSQAHPLRMPMDQLEKLLVAHTGGDVETVFREVQGCAGGYEDCEVEGGGDAQGDCSCSAG
jgi:hypothetical protein